MESAISFCQELINKLGLALKLEMKEENGVIYINLAGADRPYLLSNNAAVLNCVEYLIDKIFGIGKEEAPRIIIDSDKYRKHREAELILLAQMASQKVITMKKPLNLQPMVPRERKIVHLAIAGIEGVHTQSAGEGENRSITIYPS
jgi:spoIIIJ-associated protein